MRPSHLRAIPNSVLRGIAKKTPFQWSSYKWSFKWDGSALYSKRRHSRNRFSRVAKVADVDRAYQKASEWAAKQP